MTVLGPKNDRWNSITKIVTIHGISTESVGSKVTKIMALPVILAMPYNGIAKINGNAGNLVKHYVGLVINIDRLAAPWSYALPVWGPLLFYQSPTKASELGRFT